MPRPFRPSVWNVRRAPDGRTVPEDSEGLLPILTSALCSRTVCCSSSSSSSTWRVLALSLPLGCITNDGLTCLPLINTSADKLASHTSILVWGRLISGAHTSSTCGTSALDCWCNSSPAEGLGNYRKPGGLFHPPPLIENCDLCLWIDTVLLMRTRLWMVQPGTVPRLPQNSRAERCVTIFWVSEKSANRMRRMNIAT